MSKKLNHPQKMTLLDVCVSEKNPKEQAIEVHVAADLTPEEISIAADACAEMMLQNGNFGTAVIATYVSFLTKALGLAPKDCPEFADRFTEHVNTLLAQYSHGTNRNPHTAHHGSGLVS